MNSITIRMMAKSSQPILTYVLLTIVIAAIVCVCYLMLRHRSRTRNAKKHGHSPHTGHHGNH